MTPKELVLEVASAETDALAIKVVEYRDKLVMLQTITSVIEMAKRESDSIAGSNEALRAGFRGLLRSLEKQREVFENYWDR